MQKQNMCVFIWKTVFSQTSTFFWHIFGNKYVCFWNLHILSTKGVACLFNRLESRPSWSKATEKTWWERITCTKSSARVTTPWYIVAQIYYNWGIVACTHLELIEWLPWATCGMALQPCLWVNWDTPFVWTQWRPTCWHRHAASIPQGFYIGHASLDLGSLVRLLQNWWQFKSQTLVSSISVRTKIAVHI